MSPTTLGIHASHPFFRGLPRAMFAAFFLFSAGAAFAAPPLTVSLSSEASRPAANDLMQATLFAEAAGDAPEELSGRINRAIADALKLARTYPSIKAQSGGAGTYPVYAKNGGAIESWHMRSEISLESGDAPALSELIGKLQTSLAISSMRFLPSPQTKRQAEDAAILDALALFEARAKLLADAREKSYRIKELSITTGRSFVPASALRASARSSAPASMPIESGESRVDVTVSGKVEIE